MAALGALGTRTIGALAVCVALGAMFVDHLLAGDVAAFVVSGALCLATAAGLFLWLVPRVEGRPDASERTAALGLLLALLAIVPGIALLWIGVPIVVAGAGLALGLRGLEGGRHRMAQAAVLLGVVGVIGGFAVELGIELTDTETD